MSPPKLVSYRPPAYTAEALKNGIEGVVTIEAEFDIKGVCKIIRVLKTLGSGLDEAAVAALDDWKFVPAYRSGRRVSDYQSRL